ncbi:hypothetical protein J5N97_010574 [Dioscorea zingiberensis]|uniref:Guanylate kinase 1 n=1 Tax=Dioscorea zingiberensis TaxID=325984 RepID=A0A9D5D0B5_9LILI|nr:hypothetical protein J5N97_010574 [Dioscorea zingiberensis]
MGEEVPELLLGNFDECSVLEGNWTSNTIGGKIYVIGGAGEQETHLTTVKVFDRSAGEWVTPAVLGRKPVACKLHSTIPVDDARILVIKSDSPSNDSLWFLEVDTPFVRVQRKALGTEVVAWSKVVQGDALKPVVISGPSGVGKGTLISKLVKEFPSTFGFSVSHTTRMPREKEMNGVHYHFTERSKMEKDIREGKFLESALVHGNLYGTSIEAVEAVTDSGKTCILDIDVQGARSVRASSLEAIFIFICPPSFKELEKRLRARGTESEEQVQKRLRNASAELEQGKLPGLFDYVLVNDDLKTCYGDLKKILLLDDVTDSTCNLPAKGIRIPEGHAVSTRDQKVLIQCGGDEGLAPTLYKINVSSLIGGAPGRTRGIMDFGSLSICQVEVEFQGARISLLMGKEVPELFLGNFYEFSVLEGNWTSNTIGGKIYVIGGPGERETHLTSVKVFDRSMGEWLTPTVLGRKPIACKLHSTIPVDDSRILVIKSNSPSNDSLWFLEVDTPFVRVQRKILGTEVVAWSKVVQGDSLKTVVISGPSGVGKGTLISKLMKEFPSTFGFSVSHTTRMPREKEMDGVHYHFTERSKMEKDIREGKFLESALVHGNLYGTSIEAVETVTDSGKTCILDIGVQGARSVRASSLEAIFIFICPPSFEELEKRLRARGTESEEQVQKRLRNASAELEQGKLPGLFDYVLVNDDLETCYGDLKKILLLDDVTDSMRNLPAKGIRIPEGHAVSTRDQKVLIQCGGDEGLAPTLYKIDVSSLIGGAPGRTRGINIDCIDLSTEDSL